MNYSQTGICNVALGRIGARGQITSINENSPNAVKCLAIWDTIFQEVLSERDWKFAKTRAQLQLSPVTPLYTWKFAWALPADLLRFVRPIRRPENNQRAGGGFFYGWGPCGTGWYRREDPPFWPADTDYKIETLTSGWLFPQNATTPELQAAYNTYVAANPSAAGGPIPFPQALLPAGRYAVTNYGGWWAPAAITYIQLISDYTQLMPGFVNCLCNRLAMELAIGVTEDKGKFDQMKMEYRESLNSSEAQNECLDYSNDEDGSTTWQDAGRVVRWGV